MDVTLTCEGITRAGTMIERGEIISVDPLVKDGSHHPYLVLIHVIGIPETSGDQLGVLKDLLEEPLYEASPDLEKIPEVVRNRQWRLLIESLPAETLKTLSRNREVTILWDQAKGFLGKRRLQAPNTYDLVIESRL